MNATTVAPSLPTRTQLAPNAVIGTVVFVFAETMFFAGLVSAHTIVKMGYVGNWPPAGQPLLPASETLFNTFALLLSGVLVAVAMRMRQTHPKRSLSLMLAALVLGAFFVLFQGKEWIALLRQGLTLTSSTHGSFFYTIVGAHALHALVGLGFLFYLYLQMKKGEETKGRSGATQVYWYFVVLLWPILYLKVYL